MSYSMTSFIVTGSVGREVTELFEPFDILVVNRANLYILTAALSVYKLSIHKVRRPVI